MGRRDAFKKILYKFGLGRPAHEVIDCQSNTDSNTSLCASDRQNGSFLSDSSRSRSRRGPKTNFNFYKVTMISVLTEYFCESPFMIFEAFSNETFDVDSRFTKSRTSSSTCG